ncbi:MAG TPA: PIN domain-containing protein [Thermoplasmata archaeon]|nr:PIN domain-containing protein [Thermoplasmata archaeon]
MKLFVDANALVGGLVSEGNESLLLDLGRLGVCELVANEYIREEVRDVLARPHIGLSRTEQEAALAVVSRRVTILEDPPSSAVIAARGRIPDDDDLPILVGFEHSGCDYLVTGDRRLRERVARAVTTRTAIERVLSEAESD